MRIANLDIVANVIWRLIDSIVIIDGHNWKCHRAEMLYWKQMLCRRVVWYVLCSTFDLRLLYSRNESRLDKWMKGIFGNWEKFQLHNYHSVSVKRFTLLSTTIHCVSDILRKHKVIASQKRIRVKLSQFDIFDANNIQLSNIDVDSIRTSCEWQYVSVNQCPKHNKQKHQHRFVPSFLESTNYIG